MNATNKFITNRRLLQSSILSVVGILLLAILTSIIYLTYQREQTSLEHQTTQWAKTLAQVSAPYIIENDSDSHNRLKRQLTLLISAPEISYIHVYKNIDKPRFFTGFNKSVYYPAIPDKINEISSLSTIRYQKSYLEFVVKISSNQEEQGYLYIQASLANLDNYIERMIYICVVIFMLSIIFTSLLANAIYKKINQPILMITESIQQISHNKDFSQRLAKLPLIELDILAKNINILLHRTQKHITQQDEEHQQTLNQNTKLNEKVNARTNALKESNQELLSTLEKLHQFQGQLVENEKMASLGDMVAGIAHEVNTPIGLGVTASTLMIDKLNEIKASFEDKTLKSSQLKKFLDQGEENVNIIYRNLERAAKLIRSFKKVAVDQSSSETRQFNLKELFEEVLLTLKTRIDEAQVTITIDCDDHLVVICKPGALNQIIINLIINSIIHGFEEKPNGQISIAAMFLSQQLHISYQDDGIGIAESIKPKIFDPFTTTKRGSGGSGLGLHLVYNLVTQTLNGQIDFESSVNQGTKFEITVPIASELTS